MTGRSVTAWSVTGPSLHRGHSPCSLGPDGHLARWSPLAIPTQPLSLALVRTRLLKVFSAPTASMPCPSSQPALPTAHLLRLGRRRRWPEPPVTLGAPLLLPLLPDRVDSHTRDDRRTMRRRPPPGGEPHPSVDGPQGFGRAPALHGDGTRNQMHPLYQRWRTRGRNQTHWIRYRRWLVKVD